MNLCSGLFDVESRFFTGSNSGVGPPMFCRNDVTELVWERIRLPPGMFDEATTAKMEAGDTVFSCAGGLLESVNRRGEDCGIERLGKLASAPASHGPKKPLDNAFNQIQRLFSD